MRSLAFWDSRPANLIQTGRFRYGSPSGIYRWPSDFTRCFALRAHVILAVATQEPSKPLRVAGSPFLPWEVPMFEISHAKAESPEKTVLLAVDRDALIQTLTDYQRRLDHLGSYLRGLERESVSLQSASENIRSVVEGLSSLK